jgi:hypothetical protein
MRGSLGQRSWAEVGRQRRGVRAVAVGPEAIVPVSPAGPAFRNRIVSDHPGEGDCSSNRRIGLRGDGARPLNYQRQGRIAACALSRLGRLDLSAGVGPLGRPRTRAPRASATDCRWAKHEPNESLS